MKPRHLSLEEKNGLYGWFFIAPFILGVVFVFLGVVLQSLRFSFSSIQTVSDEQGFLLRFVGLENYYYAFRIDPDFVRQLIGSLTGFFTGVPITIFFSLFIAMVLNQKMVGRGFFRAMFLLPVLLATGIVAKAQVSNTMMQGYQSMSGIDTGVASGAVGMNVDSLKSALQSLYIGSSVTDYITGFVTDIYSVVNYSGVQIILFLAGLQSIPPSVYESAKIEGATGWESFWKITFPMLSPIIYVNVIYSIVDIFTRSDNSIMGIISSTAFDKLNYGASSAMAWVYFAGIAAVLAVVSLLSRKLVSYQN